MSRVQHVENLTLPSRNFSYGQRVIVLLQEVAANLDEMARFMWILGVLALLFVGSHGKGLVEIARMQYQFIQLWMIVKECVYCWWASIRNAWLLIGLTCI